MLEYFHFQIFRVLPVGTETFSNPYAPVSGGAMRMNSMEDDG